MTAPPKRHTPTRPKFLFEFAFQNRTQDTTTSGAKVPSDVRGSRISRRRRALPWPGHAAPQRDPVGCLYSIGGAGGECPSREKPLETDACVHSTGPQQSRQRSTAGERKTAAFQSPIEFWHPTGTRSLAQGEAEAHRGHRPSHWRTRVRSRRPHPQRMTLSCRRRHTRYVHAAARQAGPLRRP